MALGLFTGMGFHFTIDINSKMNWCFFISRLTLKENIICGGKRIGFKLTIIVTDFNYKEKCFLEFHITRLRFLVQKGSFGHLFLFLALEN